MKWNGFKKKLFKVLFYKWYVYVVELYILMIISIWSFINFIIVFNIIIELVKFYILVIVRIYGFVICMYYLWNKILDNFFLKLFCFMFLSGINIIKLNSWLVECL